MAMQTATASFTGAENFVDVTWPAMTGNFGIVAGVTTTGDGPPAIHFTNRTATGCRVNASAPFTGTVELAIFDKP